MINIKQVTENRELEGIKKLQESNLRKNLSEEEAVSQGFVTAEYTMDFLRLMHEQGPSVIAKDDDQVIGYVLAALKSVRYQHELLGDLFNTIDHISYRNQRLDQSNYIVVGQLCVSKNYRGLGLVQQMYRHFKNCFCREFDFCITDVAQDNPRSLNAHLKCGFQVIDTLQYGGMGWDIVIWDWNT